MSKRKKCARCGKELTGIYASVWSSDRGEVFYCHDDDDDCYSPATWAGYPELGSGLVVTDTVPPARCRSCGGFGSHLINKTTDMEDSVTCQDCGGTGKHLKETT